MEFLIKLLDICASCDYGEEFYRKRRYWEYALIIIMGAIYIHSLLLTFHEEIEILSDYMGEKYFRILTDSIRKREEKQDDDSCLYYKASIFEKRLYVEPHFFGSVESEPGKFSRYYDPWRQKDGHYILFKNYKEEEKRKALFKEHE